MKTPKYVQGLLGRIAPAPAAEQDPEYYGYTYRLYRRTNGVYSKTFRGEARKLCLWAYRQGAFARILGARYFSTKEHRKPHYMRDYILVDITDPVAKLLDKKREVRA